MATYALRIDFSELPQDFDWALLAECERAVKDIEIKANPEGCFYSGPLSVLDIVSFHGDYDDIVKVLRWFLGDYCEFTTRLGQIGEYPASKDLKQLALELLSLKTAEGQDAVILTPRLKDPARYPRAGEKSVLPEIWTLD